MGLKLTVATGDKIMIGDEIIAEIKSVGRRVQVEFNAPREVPIHAIFKDINQQFKNRRNNNA